MVEPEFLLPVYILKLVSPIFIQACSSSVLWYGWIIYLAYAIWWNMHFGRRNQHCQCISAQVNMWWWVGSDAKLKAYQLESIFHTDSLTITTWAPISRMEEQYTESLLPNQMLIKWIELKYCSRIYNKTAHNGYISQDCVILHAVMEAILEYCKSSLSQLTEGPTLNGAFRAVFGLES